MKGRLMYIAAALVAVAGFLLIAGPAGASRQVHATAATNATCGETLSASVTLDGDLDCTAYNGTAITIDTNGVTLDLGGHTIFGDSTDSSIDVIDVNSGVNDVTIQNGTIWGGSGDQVYIENGSDNTVTGLTLIGDVNNNVDEGIYSYESAGTTITNNTISGNYGYMNYGIDTEYSSGTTASGNTITGMDDEAFYAEYDIADTISNNYFRTSYSDGVEDYYSDQNTYSNNLVSGSDGYGFYIFGDGYGTVSMINNGARQNTDDGFYLDDNYTWVTKYGVSGPSTSLFSGNASNYNAGYGYYDDGDNYGATYENNLAARNTDDGFYFTYAPRYTITGNTAKLNNGDGFYFDYVSEGYGPTTVSNNGAWYNTGYGFYAYEYSVPGSGNVGGGTNSSGDCYAVSGCS